MRKNHRKRWLAIGLVMVILMSLCGCGNENKVDANQSLAKEHVYHVKTLELPKMYDPENGSMYIASSGHVGDKVYAIAQVYDYTNYNESDFRLLTFNIDGSDIQVKNLEVPLTNHEIDQEADISENAVVEDLETVVEEDKDIVAEDTAEAEAAVEEIDPGFGEGEIDNGIYEPSDSYEYTSYGNFLIAESGMIYGVKNHTKENYANDTYTSDNHAYICAWDSEGLFLWESEIENVATEENPYVSVNKLVEGKDGKIYAIIGGEEYSKISVDENGTMGSLVKLNENVQKVFGNYNQINNMNDGSVMVVYHDIDDYSKTYYVTYDITNDTLSEEKELPGFLMTTWDYNVMIPSMKGGLIYTGNGSVYEYQFGDTEAKLKMDCINSDIYMESFNSIIELSDTSFLGLYTSDYREGIKVGIFDYVKPEDIQDKKVLVLAGQWINYDIRKRVVDYNQNNNEYRISIKDYSSYNTYEDYDAAVKKLNNDIISGQMPDILIVNNALPIENYVNKGLLADIGKLIEKDEELSKVEFMENVFKAYSLNDKLYQIIPQFEVYTMIAKTSLLGGKNSITMKDLDQILAGMSEDATAFGMDMERNNFMYMVMRYCGSQFIDQSSGTCSFNSDSFINMMEYAKKLSDGSERENWDDSKWEEYWNNYQAQYRNNKTLLMQANLYNFQYLTETINGYFDEDITFVGFPSENGKGSYVASYDTYALSARSKNLDEAWNFMKYYLTDDYQKDVGNFPVQKSYFMEKSKDALSRPHYTDENGEEVYYDNTMYINGEEVIIEPLTQEQLDKVINFIESVDNRYYENNNVTNIINEEIEAFFSGQKSAKEVAELIQKRVQIYVDENR